MESISAAHVYDVLVTSMHPTSLDDTVLRGGGSVSPVTRGGTTHTTPMHTASRDDTLVSQYGSSPARVDTSPLFTPLHESRRDDGLMFSGRDGKKIETVNNFSNKTIASHHELTRVHALFGKKSAENLKKIEAFMRESGMSITIEQSSIVPFVDNKIVSILEQEFCSNFNHYISNEYPWDVHKKDIIDWNKVEGKLQYSYRGRAVEDIKAFILSTCLCNYQYLAIVYGADEPGIVGKSEDILLNFFALSSHTPWSEFLVGAYIDACGLYKIKKEDFVEVWKFGGLLSAPR